MKRIVILQPMFFPWAGCFEQIKQADVFVYFDDVQIPRGRSFVNRVQVKTKEGCIWMTVPLKKHKNDTLIQHVEVVDAFEWKQKHLNLLKQNLFKAPYYDEMLDLVTCIYEQEFTTINDLNIAAIESVSAYLGLKTEFVRSSELGVKTSSSQKLFDIMTALHGDVYITGHGAKNYLNHELFEEHNMKVEYMDYHMTPYPQLHGEFTPYVSVLDLVANTGKNGKDVLTSPTIYWRDFIDGSE